MKNLKRITDANLNRAAEAARVLEEIARFLLDDKDLSEKLKHIRHKINSLQEEAYEDYLHARDTENDVGVDIANSDNRINIENIFKANIKRLQQALRTLAEYSQTNKQNVVLFEKLRYETYTLEKIIWDRLKEKYGRVKLADKKLYLVTNSDKFNSEDDFLNAIASALEGGVDILQLREKTMPAKKVLELGRKVKQLCLQYDVTFIVNDRVDIAALLQADGVHLGQDDLDVKSAREILGANAIVGVSTHAPQQALKAVEDGADYIGVGPVFATPTKQGRTPVGLEYVEWVSKNIDIPAFAIGGIDLENFQQVFEAGLNRIAVVRAIMNAKSPQLAAEELWENIQKTNVPLKCG
ncbi:MAG: thiamine phosphate synthase [Candidatus Gastranaerophilales bacterium]|nr:thiamine phosphate synthase [Candidatus Gastranaerophilales bacterium]